jgi:hypothetical protein
MPIVSGEKEGTIEENLRQRKINFRHVNHAALAISSLVYL